MTAQTYTITLTDAELRLVRAGLAAHSIALSPYVSSDDDAERTSARVQRADARDLSTRLGDLQLAALNPPTEFCHYLAIDAGGNKIGRCNLTPEQVRVHLSNLEVSGYRVKVVKTAERIAETDEALIATVQHPLF